MKENIVSGQAYRILRGTSWDRLSFWKKASDVVFDDGSTMEENKPISILQREREYRQGDIAYEPTAPSWVLLECVAQGYTAETVPYAYKNLNRTDGPGTVITDGDAQFVVYSVVPSTVLSTSSYIIPAMNLVNEIKSNLIASDGAEFYFDYRDGAYGFNTDPQRGAETFIPF